MDTRLARIGATLLAASVGNHCAKPHQGTLEEAAHGALAASAVPVNAAPASPGLAVAARSGTEGAGPAPATPLGEGSLYVPASPGAQRLPLLIFLHGLGGSGEELAQHLRLREFAELRGFAFAAPDGAMDYAGRRYWNATRSCCDFDRRRPDHIAQLRRLIEQAREHPRVDSRRVYLIGYSNGGFLAYRAGCELTRLLAGIVSIAGAAPSKQEPCKPDGPLTVLQIHGTRDPIVAFEGGHLFADRRFPRHPSAEASILFWARHAGCSEPGRLVGTLDLDPAITGGETEIEAYAGCNSGRIELWRIVGGNHSSGLSPFSLDAIWHFIETSDPER